MQEQFGLANDATVARSLVEGEAQGPGAWAAGVAEGWVRARSRRARSRAAKAWEALLEADPHAHQVLVERVKRQRFAEATGTYDTVLATQSALSS